jgi:multidrug resistance efflux pump
LSKIKVGQQVTVKIDTENEMKSYPGTVSWIARIYTKNHSNERRTSESGICRKISVKK